GAGGGAGVAPLRGGAAVQVRADPPPPDDRTGAAAAPQEPSAATRLARVALVRGQLMVRAADANDYRFIEENATLQEGDSLWTGEKGLAEIELERDSRLRMGEQTKIELRRLPPESDLRLWAGSIYVDVSERLAEGLPVPTSPRHLRAAPGPVARIDTFEDDHAAVAVARGRVMVTPERGDSIRVAAGRRLAVALGQEPDFPRSLGDALDRDALDRFEQERERFYGDHP